MSKQQKYFAPEHASMQSVTRFLIFIAELNIMFQQGLGTEGQGTSFGDG